MSIFTKYAILPGPMQHAFVVSKGVWKGRIYSFVKLRSEVFQRGWYQIGLPFGNGGAVRSAKPRPP